MRKRRSATSGSNGIAKKAKKGRAAKWVKHRAMESAVSALPKRARQPLRPPEQHLQTCILPVLGELMNVKNEAIGVGLPQEQLPPAALARCRGRDREPGIPRLLLLQPLLPLELQDVLRGGPLLLLLLLGSGSRSRCLRRWLLLPWKISGQHSTKSEEDRGMGAFGSLFVHSLRDRPSGKASFLLKAWWTTRSRKMVSFARIGTIVS